MTDELTTEVVPAPAVEQPHEEKPAEQVFTKSEVEALMKKRLSKFSDYDDLKTRAAKAEEYESAQLSAAEKLTKERDEALARAADIEARATAAERSGIAREVAVKVAGQIGIRPEAALKLAHTFIGDDEEAITASAADILQYLKPEPASVPPAVNDVTAADSEEQSIKKAFLGIK